PTRAVVLVGGRENRLEGRDDRCVELSSHRLRKAHAGHSTRQRLAVRAIRRHCVICVGDTNNPSKEWDFIAVSAVRIPHAVDALVMRTDDVADFRVVVDVAQDPFADLRVLLHLSTLVQCEWAGLLEQTGRKPDLPYVMDEAAKVNQLLLLL